MLPKNRPPTSPGEVLSEEFLEPMGMTQLQLATKTGMAVQRVNLIVNGKRGVTAETALLFAKVLKTTPEFWMNLQASTDLWVAREAMRPKGPRSRARSTQHARHD